MSCSIPEYDSITPFASVESCRNSVQLSVELNRETKVPIDAFSYAELASFSGMTKTPETLSEIVSKNFSALDNVQAVLAGESDDVLHVWVMIRDWTPEARKKVYAIQKHLLKQMRGFNFDFYVIDLPEGTQPEDSVSGIPLIFNRAKQNAAPAHRQEQ
jgi:hypothetical protein